MGFNGLPQRSVPQHKVSNDSNSLRCQLTLSVTYQQADLLGSCELISWDVRKELLQLSCCYTLVHICNVVQSIANQLVGLKGASGSLHSDF